MNTITLKDNQISRKGLTFNIELIAYIVFAFFAGMVCMIEPLILIAIPILLVSYGTIRMIKTVREVLSMDLDLDLDEFSISLSDIIDDLEQNDHK